MSAPKGNQHARTHGEAGGTHTTKTPEYRVWESMKSRCYSPGSSSRENYGGRGITVCDRWRDSYEAFLADMGRRPSPKYTLERKDNDGPYELVNCVWALRKVQINNRRTTRWIEFDGKRLPLAVWAEQLGLTYRALYMRLYSGKPIAEALTMPPDPRRTNYP